MTVKQKTLIFKLVKYLYKNGIDPYLNEEGEIVTNIDKFYTLHNLARILDPLDYDEFEKLLETNAFEEGEVVKLFAED